MLSLSLSLSLAVLAIAPLAACTYHHRALPAPGALAGQRVTVTTGDGRAHAARLLPDGSGTLVWHTDGGQVLRAGAVRSIERTNRVRGMFEGLGIGALAGAAGGAMLGYSDGDDPPCAEGSWLCLRFDATDKAVLAGAFFAGIGGTVGALVGLVRGSRDRYELSDERGLRVSPWVGPQGAGAAAAWTF